MEYSEIWNKSPLDKGTTKAETKLYGYWPYIN
jgi:hypothetical protein